MARGYAIVGLSSPKDPANVGAVLRAAFCYNAAQVLIENARGKALNHATNTPFAHRHIPTLLCSDMLEYRPHGAQIVVVDLIPRATPLYSFKHPMQAFYIFGPEDGTLGRRFTDLAQHVVYVPTRTCMNLAATVNVVLYDCLAKQMQRKAA